MDLSGKRVLIVRLSALGDVLRTLPAVAGLQQRFKDATFFWLVEKPSAGLLSALPGIHPIIIAREDLRKGGPLGRLSALKNVVKQLKALQIDVSIDFHGVLKSGIFPWLAKIPQRIGFERGGSKEGHRWFLNHRVMLKDPAISRYERNLALVRSLDPSLEPRVPNLILSEDETDEVASVMRNRPILFFPGTSAHGRNKRWPATYWAHLYRKVKASHPVLFSFGPADAEYRGELSAQLGDTLEELPSFSLAQFAKALMMSRMLVSCDTGPLHLAAIFNVPVVAMMGPSDPVLNQPSSGLREVILPGVACAPCRNRNCQVLICQDVTTPQRVEQAVVRMMARTEEAGS